jgi:nucleoside-diphosphate-sugar epimerase
MQILVTGGTGFLGRHVVWRLAGQGHGVVFTGRSRPQAELVLAQLGAAAARVRFIEVAHGTADSARVLAQAVEGAAAVVHCAALSSPWGRRADFMRANVASTREVIDACAAQRIGRLVNISTPSLYFDFRDRLGIREDEPLPPPVNAYAQTKGIAEQLALHSGIEQVISLRPRAIFGAWDNTLLPRLLRVARQARLPLMRGGAAQVDLTYVDNVVDAVELALHAPLQRATFNLSNGEPMAVLALFNALAQAFDFAPRFVRVPYPLMAAVAGVFECAGRLAPHWEPPLTRYSAGLLAFSQTLDLTQARATLGYAPRVSFAQGLHRTAAWFAAHPQGRS